MTRRSAHRPSSPVRSNAPGPALRRRALAVSLLAPSLLVAGCSNTKDYPSLSIRPVETSLQARPAPSQSEAAPALPSADADLTTRLDGLLAVARAANASFLEKRPEAERAIARAGSRASDSWSAAQVALSDLERSRSNAMTALADLDQLYVAARDEAPNAPSPKALTIATARDQVNGWVADQDAVIATLGKRLGA